MRAADATVQILASERCDCDRRSDRAHPVKKGSGAVPFYDALVRRSSTRGKDSTFTGIRLKRR